MKDRLKLARKAANKKQGEVALALGVSESTYCGYETGKRSPDALKIVSLARILGVSGDYLLGMTDDPYPHTYTATTDDEKRLLRLFRAMTADRQAALMTTAEAFAK